MARWAFDDNVPRVRPRLRVGRTVEEEAVTEPPPPRARQGRGAEKEPDTGASSRVREAKGAPDRAANSDAADESKRKSSAKSNQTSSKRRPAETRAKGTRSDEGEANPASDAVDGIASADRDKSARDAASNSDSATASAAKVDPSPPHIQSKSEDALSAPLEPESEVSSDEAASTENAVASAEDGSDDVEGQSTHPDDAAEPIEDAAPASPSRAAIRSLIGALSEGATSAATEVETAEEQEAETESAASLEPRPSPSQTTADETAEAPSASNSSGTSLLDDAEAADLIDRDLLDQDLLDRLVAAAPAHASVPAPTTARAQVTTGHSASVEARQTSSTAAEPAKSAFEAAARRSEIKRRAAGLGAALEAPAAETLSLFDDLDPVSAATELAGELERALAEAAEANEQLRRDLNVALDDLARATREVKRLTESRERLEEEARERTRIVQDLVQEMELLESERDGALSRGSDAALKMESLREKLDFGERRVRELERQLTEAQGRARRLEEANAAQASQRAALRAEVESLRRERDELLAQNSELNRERDELVRSKEALDEIHRALAEARQRAQRIRPR